MAKQEYGSRLHEYGTCDVALGSVRRFPLSLPTVCCLCANLWRHINVNLIKWLLPFPEYLWESKKCDKTSSVEESRNKIDRYAMFS